ncbi:MAG: UDP-N-acetylmuramoyl-L-alanine--D-glutamate ligase, partial [Nitrososphaeraceae archaeon]
MNEEPELSVMRYERTMPQSVEDMIGGKKIAVLGLGVEGLATARFLHKNGITFYVLDRKEKDAIEQKIITEILEMGGQFHLGENYLENLTEYDVIVRSPGIRRLTPELLAAEKAGIVITSHTKLFFDLCPGKIIGVTGTKGKGTTASLIYQMLKDADKDVY